jgi:hypothetical protein
MRRAYLVPLPEAGSLDDLNTLKAVRCAREEHRRRRAQDTLWASASWPSAGCWCRRRSGPSGAARATQRGPRATETEYLDHLRKELWTAVKQVAEYAGRVG